MGRYRVVGGEPWHVLFAGLELAAYGTLVRTYCDICGDLALIFTIVIVFRRGANLLNLSLYLGYVVHDTRAMSPNNSARIKPRSHVLDTERQQDVSRQLPSKPDAVAWSQNPEPGSRMLHSP